MRTILVTVCAILLGAVCFAQDSSNFQGEQEKIKGLELILKQNPDAFNWGIHNELRHLYGAIDPRKSAEHSDIILKNAIMDGYILNILSGWQINGDSDIAIVNLLMQVQPYPDLKFIWAACLIKVGDLYRDKSDYEEAKTYYRKVAEDKSCELSNYQKLANMRLKRIDKKT